MSNTAVVAVSHATCFRTIAYTHHTHHTRICNANTRIEAVHTNMLYDCCTVVATKYRELESIRRGGIQAT